MIVVGGKNDTGHILHLIVGPESEFYMDVHGAKVMDITPLLVAMNGSSHVFLSLSRCKSEASTAQTMIASDIPHLNSFNKPEPVKQDAPNVNALLKRPAPKKAVSMEKQAEVITQRTGCCEFCNSVGADLVNIPGFKICASCAQIELGKSKTKGSQSAERKKEVKQ